MLTKLNIRKISKYLKHYFPLSLDLHDKVFRVPCEPLHVHMWLQKYRLTEINSTLYISISLLVAPLSTITEVNGVLKSYKKRSMIEWDPGVPGQEWGNGMIWIFF